MPHRNIYKEAHELKSNEHLLYEVTQQIADYAKAGKAHPGLGRDYIMAAKIIHLVRNYDALQNKPSPPKTIKKFLIKIGVFK